MRTKEAEEREVQERTWIYLLHDQAPPTTARHVTPAVLAARSAGVMGDGAHLPLLPPMSAASSSHSNNGSAAGPYLYQRPNQHHHQQQQQQHASPYATPYHGAYDAYGRPVHAAANNSNSNNGSAGYPYNYAASGADFMVKNPQAPRPSSSVVTASEKWHVPAPSAYDEHMHQQQNRGFPPLRAMLSKSDKLPFQIQTPTHQTGPVVMKQQPVETPRATVTKSKSKKKSADAAGLLPKKRRHDEIDEEYVAPPASGDLDDLDDDEAKAAKRNCFPKKCDFPMCKNSSRSRGFCYSHGGGRRCRMDGCNNGAVSRDLCKRHGGGRRCRISGCKSSSESGGLCYSHGGGRRCSLSWCSARAKKGGFCAVHIGNENAEPPTEETETSTDAAATAVSTAAADTVEETKASAVVPPNVAETLLSLAHVASSPTGEASPTSPSLPELSTPRYSSIASILN